MNSIEDQVYAGEILGQPGDSAGHGAPSFWSQADGDCEWEYAEKTDGSLFTIAQFWKMISKVPRTEYRGAGEGSSLQPAAIATERLMKAVGARHSAKR